MIIMMGSGEKKKKKNGVSKKNSNLEKVSIYGRIGLLE